MWMNDTKCKYMFMVPLKNVARKGLSDDKLFCHQVISSCCRCIIYPPQTGTWRSVPTTWQCWWLIMKNYKYILISIVVFVLIFIVYAYVTMLYTILCLMGSNKAIFLIYFHKPFSTLRVECCQYHWHGIHSRFYSWTGGLYIVCNRAAWKRSSIHTWSISQHWFHILT